jgi:hypothetical protein
MIPKSHISLQQSRKNKKQMGSNILCKKNTLKTKKKKKAAMRDNVPTSCKCNDDNDRKIGSKF